MKVFLFWCIVLAGSKTANAFGSGAPLSACVTMTPGHPMKSPEKEPISSEEEGTDISPQNVTSPYSIALSSDTYGAGQKITVTITGGPFRGFLIQARRSDGTDVKPLGTFVEIPDQMKFVSCKGIRDASVTHSNASYQFQEGTKLVWEAPKQVDNDITFYATFAKTYSEFWVMVESPVLKSSAVKQMTITWFLPLLMLLSMRMI